MNSEPPAAFWNLVDAVLLINLDHREDRWEKFQTAAAGIIPSGKLHRISAVLGKALPGYGIRPWFRGRKRDLTWAARAGCTLSHRRALAMARERGWQTVLILEDDVAMDGAFSSLLESIALTLKRNENGWQICYLGFTDPAAPCRIVDRIGADHGLFEISGCLTTHAYLIKPKLRDWILDQLPEEKLIWPWLARHRAIDRWYKKVLSRRFPVTCISPAVIDQEAGFSDIAQRETGHFVGYSHLLHVPESYMKTSAFGLRHGLRCEWTRLFQVCDVSRGLVKRLRGF